MLTRQRRPWTLEEDQLLRGAVATENPGTSNPSKWSAVSKHVPDRTNKDCRKRWMSTFSDSVVSGVKGAWKHEEDQQLIRAVDECGPRWCRVSQKVPGRNSDQCAKRWKDTLDPAIDHSKWSPEADEKLLQAVAELGKSWSKVAKQYFPGRTGLAAKNRYNSLVNKQRSSCSRSHPSSSASPLGVWSPSSSKKSGFSEEHPLTDFEKHSASPEAQSPTITEDLLSPSGQGMSMYGIPFDLHHPYTSNPGSSYDQKTSAFHIYSPTPAPPAIAVPTKLYGPPRSSATAGVAVVLHEKQIPYEFVTHEVSTGTGADSDVLYMDDHGVAIHGRHAICQYLSEQYAQKSAKLVPDANDPRAIQLFEQAMFCACENGNFETFARNALCEAILISQPGILPSDIFSRPAMAELADKLDEYESILSRQKYLAGNEITLVDLYHLPYGQMLSNFGIDLLFTKGPNICRWWTEISSRPSWAALRNGVPLEGSPTHLSAYEALGN